MPETNTDTPQDERVPVEAEASEQETTEAQAAEETTEQETTDQGDGAQVVDGFEVFSPGKGPKVAPPKRQGPGQRVVTKLYSPNGCSRNECHKEYGYQNGAGLENWAFKLARHEGGKVGIKRGKNKMTTKYRVIKPE